MLDMLRDESLECHFLWPFQPKQMPSIVIYPQDGEPWLDWLEVERRVRVAFESVELDREAGREYVARTLKMLQDFPNAPPESVQKLRAAVEVAVMVSAWDGECRPENGVQFIWQPEEQLYLQYAQGSRRHATKLRKALGYQFDEA
jgi:hypothetical protein